MLVGYPVIGVPGNDRGKMHATTPANLNFSRLYQPGQPVYATTDIAAFPGNSGGPLCVQFSDGNYYPAAVYLGGTAQTLVRAIDSTAVALINRAETSGNGGGNNVSGGATIVGPGLGAGQFTPGTLACNLGPSPADIAGAGWRIAGSVGYQGRAAKLTLAAGRFRVEFKPVPGFSAPPARDVEVVAGQNTVVDGTYRAAAAAMTSARRVHASTGQQFQYPIVATNNPATFGASGLPAGLSVNMLTGVISGIPQSVGTFEAEITAGAASAPLKIIVEKPGSLTVVISGRGAVTNGFAGTGTRVVGRNYSITAVAAPDMLFDGWSGDIPAVTPKITFTMEDGLVLRVNFVPNPYLTRPGSYHGLLQSASGTGGIAVVSLSKSGGCTIKLTLDGRAYTLSGSFDMSGHFTGEITRRGLTPLAIALVLDTLAAEARISGTVTADGDPLTLDAARADFTSKTPAPSTGGYTLGLPPDPPQPNAGAFPAGHGYALVTVSVTGGISAVGRLGDNTPLAASGAVCVDGSWALYARPYAGKGLLAGVLTFTAHAAPGTDEISGPLHWEKPSGATPPYPTASPAASPRLARDGRHLREASPRSTSQGGTWKSEPACSCRRSPRQRR